MKFFRELGRKIGGLRVNPIVKLADYYVNLEKNMYMKQLFELAIIITLAVHSQMALAAGSFTAQSDVAGIALGMSADDAKKAIVANNPGAVVLEVPVGFSAHNIIRKPLVGYVADITAMSDSKANDETAQKMASGVLGSSPLDRPVAHEGDFGTDELRISVDPNAGSHKVYSVSRFVTYPKENRPVMQTAVEALIEKYGRPAALENQGITRMYWLLDSGIGKSSGLLQQCKQEASHYNEEVGVSDNFRLNGLSRDVTSTSWQYLVNYILTPQYFKGIKTCGIFLDVWISPANGAGRDASVSSMQEFFIDLPSGYDYVRSYVEDFWREANSADQKDIDARSKNKPKL